MTALGKTTNGTGESFSSAAKTVVSKHTASATENIISGAARLWVDTGTASVRMCVYADSAGDPGALVSISDAEIISNTTEAEIPFTFPGTDGVVNGSDYHIGFTWPDPGTNNIYWSRDTTASQAKQNSSDAADPFGTPGSALSGPVDAYVTTSTAAPADSGAFFEFF